MQGLVALGCFLLAALLLLFAALEVEPRGVNFTAAGLFLVTVGALIERAPLP